MEEASLNSILAKLRDFRRDNRQQMLEIQQDLHRKNDRLDVRNCFGQVEEGRIEEMETSIQAASSLIKQLP